MNVNLLDFFLIANLFKMYRANRVALVILRNCVLAFAVASD